MSKMYVKDPNGKYRLVDKEEPGKYQTTLETNSKPLTVEERLARLEEFFFKGDKK